MKPFRLKKTPVPTKPPMAPAPSNPKVEVYCRIQPVQTEEDSCVNKLSDTVVQIVPPEPSQGYRSGATEDTQYTFAGVFDEKVSQKPIFHTVAFPLIEDLLHGKNSLLFAYGVTGSGKTHTMNGELQDGGIIPRCLDVIFNSIDHLLADKFTFRPDRFNSFEIQTQVDAKADRKAEGHGKLKTPAPPGQEVEGPRVKDGTKISGIDEDQSFAVFITFVEVFNNSVFDLLDDTQTDRRPGEIQSKILSEDQHHNIYVPTVTEVEVRSADEAAEVLAMGRKRRRVGNSTLHEESSRNLSVFNIRIVQAPLDSQGAVPIPVLTVGQLSLVELAGSEENNRTQTSGEELREAGSINSTLMTLRSCILSENQLNNKAEMVPYEDTNITLVFKNYFNGGGKVRMIACVNPRADDYDETLSVMRFAEMAQDVQITRADQPNVRLEATRGTAPRSALIPGRRKANRILTEVYRKLEQDGISSLQSLIPFDIGMVFDAVRCSWSPLEIHSASDVQLISNVHQYLLVKIIRDYREMKDEVILKRQEVGRIRDELFKEQNRSQTLANHVLNRQARNVHLKRILILQEKLSKLLKKELNDKDELSNQFVVNQLKKMEIDELEQELNDLKENGQVESKPTKLKLVRNFIEACSGKVSYSSKTDKATQEKRRSRSVEDGRVMIQVQVQQPPTTKGEMEITVSPNTLQNRTGFGIEGHKRP